MRENLEKLAKVYALSENQYQDILEMIIRNAVHNKVPVNRPKNIVIAGQPGSGKSVLRYQTLVENYQNAVVCDVDNYRDYHPLVREIKKYHEPLYGEITNEYAHRWNRDLCRYCRQHKLNYILETTFKDGDCQNQSMRAAKEHGYGIEVKLLAVHPMLSTLGIYLRYEEAKRLRGNGRMVPPEYHDMCYHALRYSIPKVQRAGVFDDIRMYSRSVVIENNRLEKGVSIIAHNPQDPLEVHLKEVNRSWTDEMWDFTKEKSTRVLALMEARNASQEEVLAFKKNVSLDPVGKLQQIRHNSLRI